MEGDAAHHQLMGVSIMATISWKSCSGENCYAFPFQNVRQERERNRRRERDKGRKKGKGREKVRKGERIRMGTD